MSLWFKQVPVWLGLLAGALLLAADGSASTAPDAFLYYQRTHHGALPPPGANVSDHSGETADVVPARPFQPTPFAPAPQGVHPLVLRDNGVDPANLGKGDWIWEMPQTETQLGVTTVQGVIDYETGLGMQWITVKCGDGGSTWSQFNSDLVTRAHTAGLKIFGWGYAYGNNVAGEISVATNALGLGADGFIIDAEIEYETNANRVAAATQYCQGIRSVFPNRFLAHAPFPYISYHAQFPYIQFGTYCDAVMPQDYWGAIGITPTQMVSDMNSQWITWQNSLTGANTNAIKPLAPLGQSYAPVTGAQITTFLAALKTNTPVATPGGFKGVSFWDAQERNADMNNAVLAATIGDATSPPYFPAALLDRVADTGSALTWHLTASGAAPMSYQWTFNGARIAGATGTNYTIPSLTTNHTGNYALVATNAHGSATSGIGSLTVYPPQVVVFSDNFDTNSAGSWTVNKSSTDTRVTFNYNYAADGIPPAPHSTGGTTRGVKLEANITAGVGAAVSLSPAGRSFSGDCRLHFDFWINVNGPFPAGGSGSTEFLTAGIVTAGNRVEWTGPGTTADGYWFSADGDGGVAATSTTSGDYGAYLGTALQATATGIYAAGADSTARDNANPYYLAAFPGGLAAPARQQSTYAQQTGALAAGTFGFAWHDGIISRRGTTVEWSVDGIKLATITGASLAAGNAFVGYWDPFASLTDNTNLSFGLVDNVRVESPAIAPAITLQPTNQSVKLSSNATFTVTASGSPPLSYQWLLNGANVPAATAAAYSITNVQSTNTGNYRVVVTNIAGVVTSATATLQLLPPQPVQFQSFGLLADQRVQLGLTGEPGRTYLVLTSSNLVDWQTAATLVDTNGVFSYIDVPATNSARFYRAKLAP